MNMLINHFIIASRAYSNSLPLALESIIQFTFSRSNTHVVSVLIMFACGRGYVHALYYTVLYVLFSQRISPSRPCWEYALAAIIKWFISIFMLMIIVYSPCYNFINRKHNTYVEYKQPVVPSKPLPD